MFFKAFSGGKISTTGFPCNELFIWSLYISNSPLQSRDLKKEKHGQLDLIVGNSLVYKSYTGDSHFSVILRLFPSKD